MKIAKLSLLALLYSCNSYSAIIFNGGEIDLGGEIFSLNNTDSSFNLSSQDTPLASATGRFLSSSISLTGFADYISSCGDWGCDGVIDTYTSGTLNFEVTSNEIYKLSFSQGFHTHPNEVISINNRDTGEELIFIYYEMQNQPLQLMTGNYELTFSARSEWSHGSGRVGVFDFNLVQAVPIPASAWLLGSSCLGLIGLRRKPKTS